MSCKREQFTLFYCRENRRKCSFIFYQPALASTSVKYLRVNNKAGLWTRKLMASSQLLAANAHHVNRSFICKLELELFMHTAWVYCQVYTRVISYGMTSWKWSSVSPLGRRVLMLPRHRRLFRMMIPFSPPQFGLNKKKCRGRKRNFLRKGRRESEGNGEWGKEEGMKCIWLPN